MMMFSQVFPGLTTVCDRCGCLLGYTPKDIYGKVIYCPQCRNAIEIPYDKNYDGVVK